MRRTTSLKTLSIFLSIALFAIGAFAQPKKDRDAAKKLADQAEVSLAKKDFRDAADKLGQALILVPTSPERHYKKGFAHYELKETDEAIKEFNLALSQGYKPVEIYNVRAYVYKDAKNYDAALEEIKKALALNAKNTTLLKLAGEINLERGAYTAALESFQKAAAIDPKDADVQFHVAQVYFALGDTKAQLAAAEKAVAGGTRFPGDAYFLLGDANQKLRNPAAAIPAYQRAISSKPQLFLAYRALSEVFRSEGRYADAIAVSKEGLKFFVASGAEYVGTLYTDLSWYYSLSDRPDDAVAAGRSAVQLLPNRAMGFTNLCRAYNDSKNYELALSACNSALKLNPGDGETNFYLGRAYNLLGRNTDATRFYTAAVTGLVSYTQANPSYSDGWYLLGNAYFADNQRDKAIEAYQQCLKLSPRFAKARYNLGYIYTLKKDKTAAMDQYNGLINLDQKLAIALKTEIDRIK